MQRDIDRFLALVRRELGADDASIVEAGESTSTDGEPDPRVLRSTFPDGRGAVVARFDAEPAERDAKQRRLDMLASTFDAVAETTAPPPSSRPPPERSLRDELHALCERAAALNALVIDAHSPIIWGAAAPDGVVEGGSGEGTPSPDGTPLPSAAETSRKALRAVREVVDIAAMRKGPRARSDASPRSAPGARRIRHVERSGDAPFLALSFAGIYLLVLVFPAPFDELRAERALLESMTRIERLVLALPPRDPPPPTAGEGVVAIRRARRK